MADATLTILVGTTKTTLTVKEWLQAQKRIESTLARSKVRCGACGRSTLPLDKCESCGSSR